MIHLWHKWKLIKEQDCIAKFVTISDRRSVARLYQCTTCLKKKGTITFLNNHVLVIDPYFIEHMDKEKINAEDIG